MGKSYFTSIMSNKSRRLYVGITSELQVRVFQHKKGWHEGSFTARYSFDLLVYFEAYSKSRRRHCPGKGNQGLVAGEEVTTHSGSQSGLG